MTLVDEVCHFLDEILRVVFSKKNLLFFRVMRVDMAHFYLIHKKKKKNISKITKSTCLNFVRNGK